MTDLQVRGQLMRGNNTRLRAVDMEALVQAREERPQVLLRLANGWTLSVASEPTEGSLHRRTVAAWPTADVNKGSADIRWYQWGGEPDRLDRRVWGLDDLAELLCEIAAARPPEDGP